MRISRQRMVERREGGGASERARAGDGTSYDGGSQQLRKTSLPACKKQINQKRSFNFA
jgi:hypothetical protein